MTSNRPSGIGARLAARLAAQPTSTRMPPQQPKALEPKRCTSIALPPYPTGSAIASHHHASATEFDPAERATRLLGLYGRRSPRDIRRDAPINEAGVDRSDPRLLARLRSRASLVWLAIGGACAAASVWLAVASPRTDEFDDANRATEQVAAETVASLDFVNNNDDAPFVTMTPIVPGSSRGITSLAERGPLAADRPSSRLDP